MRRRVKGLISVAALVFGVSLMTLLSGSGSAIAAQPIVVGSCDATVQGTAGQPVSLAPAAVLGIVTDAVRAVPILGPPLAGTANQAFAALPPIPIGAIPNGTGFITGATIANAVNAQLAKIPLLGPVLNTVLGTVQTQLTALCGVTVTVANAAAAPVQDGAKAVGDASEAAVGQIIPGAPGSTGGTPGSPGSNTGTTPGGTSGTPAPNQPVLGGLSGLGLELYQPGLWDFGRSPMADYSGIPYARPGLWAPSPGVRYGGDVPGYSPEYGTVGDAPADNGVSVAGRAEALNPPASQRVELPVLLAVLALSCVTAALVRTWVLRRVPTAAM